MSTMSGPPFSSFTSFESQRSSPPNIPTYASYHNQSSDYNYPTPPTANDNHNNHNNINNNYNNAAGFPSPTLTNPDMILPDEGERESSTPSPPFRPLQFPSPEHSSYRRDSVEMDNGVHVSSAGIGVALSATANNAPHNYYQRNPPPRNNWMFEGHEVRPPLSDIGEEESPTRSRWDEDENDRDVNEMVLDSPPVLKPQWQTNHSNRVLGYDGSNGEDGCDGEHDDCNGEEEKDDHDDAVSCSASSSTISAPSAILDKWEEFRANGNPAGGVHPEDATEEHSQRHSHESERAAQDVAAIEAAERDRKNMDAIKEEEEAEDEFSSALLSSEAERILENAKRRLTHMEGNLSRARTSLRMTPSPSLLMGTLPLSARQSIGGRSHTLSERRAQTSLAGALMRQRVSQDMGTNSRHSRGLSDLTAPLTQNNLANRDNMRPQFRSFSALGSTNASGFGADDASPRRDRFGPKVVYRSSVSTFNYVPEDPSELVGNDVSQPDSPPSKSDLLPAQQNNGFDDASPENHASRIPKISSVEEFNATYPASVPSRSQSQLHVRDLRDQMQDLRSKISSLKVQAQEDNLRRRSLQSLRTPSPFTAAEQWYTTASEYVNAHGKDMGGSLNGQDDERHRGVGQDQGHDGAIPTETSSAPATITESRPKSISTADRPDDQQSVIASLYEDADEEFAYDESEEIDREALAEILNEPLDSPTSSDGELYEDFPPMPPVSETERHEDRVDAFDYEHFFLHSALGNYSRDRALRRESYSSTDSAETTRPASQATVYLDSSSHVRHGHVRTNSGDTISTSATFATATEGADSAYDEVYSGDEIDNALYWNGNSNGARYSNNDLRYRHHSRDSRRSNRHSQTRQTMIATPNNGSRHSTSSSTSSTQLSTASTPRASNKPSSIHSRQHSRHHSSDASSTREAAAHLRSPTAMISSLISSAAAQHYTADSSETDPVVFDAQLGADDTKLMESLFQSLGKVALQLQLSASATGDKRSSADERSSVLFRRRLDAARRVLDGQLDV